MSSLIECSVLDLQSTRFISVSFLLCWGFCLDGSQLTTA